MSNFRLKVFHSVAIHLNFTQAAEELYISQPAVSKNIRELEAELNICLFDRIKGKVFLTEAGEELFKYTREILQLEENLQFKLSKFRDQLKGHIKLGASTTIGQYVLPAVLAEFHKLYPDIHISLINDNTQKIEKLLTLKEIDLGLVEGISQNSQLKYIPFIKDEIVVVTHTSRSIASLDEMTIDELQTAPIVLREQGSGSLDVIIEKLKAKGIRFQDLNIVMHLGSTESIKTYIAHSDTLGIISIHAINKELSRGEYKIIDVMDFSMERMFSFVHLHGQQRGLVGLFITFAQKYYNQKL